MTIGQLIIGSSINLVVDEDGKIQVAGGRPVNYTVAGYCDNGTVLEDHEGNFLTLDHQRLEVSESEIMMKGKFKGVHLDKVPVEYLNQIWVLGLKYSRSGHVARYIEKNLPVLEKCLQSLSW